MSLTNEDLSCTMLDDVVENRDSPQEGSPQEGMCGCGNKNLYAPLRQWIMCEWMAQFSAQLTTGDVTTSHKVYIQKTILIAFGIAELLRHTRSSTISINEQYDIDNFVVRKEATNFSEEEDVFVSVDMVSPKLSVNLVEITILRSDLGECEGRYFKAQLFPSHTVCTSELDQNKEVQRCYLFGLLLYKLFSNKSLLPASKSNNVREMMLCDDNDNSSSTALELAKKKPRLIDDDTTFSSSDGTRHSNSKAALECCVYIALLEQGIPSTLCLLIQNLLDCGSENRNDGTYNCLDDVIKDLHKMLFDPSRFLVDPGPTYDTNGQISISFQGCLLYGRENEEALIMDQFCRVSTVGKSESLFIGGFAGSGKSRLIKEMSDRLDGGYILMKKFDQLPKVQPLFELVALFNDLCLRILEKNTDESIHALVDDLIGVFGPDLSNLARLLSNTKALAPHLKLCVCDHDSDSKLNLESMCFTLQSFLKIVSSGIFPVVLFLDDLQWCDEIFFTALERITCCDAQVDESTTSCLCFVGTYRTNEVASNHELFHLAQKMNFSGVRTTMMKLEGLNSDSLNAMISNTLCVLPRISKPLSEIVYLKTNG